MCLKEEIRAIINKSPSKWGAELVAATREVGDGRMIDLMKNDGSVELIKELLNERVERKRDQNIEGDWVKVEKSSFCPLYQEVKKIYEREEYWDFDIIGNVKEASARLRRGNIGRDGKKGYANSSCRVCEEKENVENLKHTFECEKARKEIKMQWVESVDR